MKEYSMNKNLYALFTLTTILGLLTACSGKTDTTAATTPAPVANVVTAEGHLVPNQSLYLPFLVSGRVSEVLVAKGDRVAAGQVLARIGDTQQAESALAGAKLAEIAAQQDYDTLTRTANLARAQAWTASLDAQKNRAIAQLAWDKVDTNAIQTDLHDATAEVTDRQTDLENAQKDFNKYSDLPAENASRKTYEDALRTAQTNYDGTKTGKPDRTARPCPRRAGPGACCRNRSQPCLREYEEWCRCG
jgi:multidrug efflux pump subunit AcrA (membrane-fusion protein)